MASLKFGYAPTHPGEVLKDEAIRLGRFVSEVAVQMGVSYKALNDLLNCRRPLTTATAIMLEAALGVPADSLMRLQLKYNMHKAYSDKSLLERLAAIRKFSAVL